MYGIKEIIFTKEYRCFSKKTKINFLPGVNIIVGDQGTGKSTLYETIKELATKNKPEYVKHKAEPIGIYAFDFEKDSHRTQSRFSPTLSYGFQAQIRFMSHGEYVKTLFYQINKIDKKALILMDEPDTAMSPKSCLQLGRLFQRIVDEQDCQVICMCHNPILFMTQEKVFSLEHIDWISPAEYLEYHLTEKANEEWF